MKGMTCARGRYAQEAGEKARRTTVVLVAKQNGNPSGGEHVRGAVVMSRGGDRDHTGGAGQIGREVCHEVGEGVEALVLEGVTIVLAVVSAIVASITAVPTS